MNAKRTPKIAPVLLATAIALGIAVPAAAESAAELLEKGIYTEQTVGDLTAAIEIYKRVVENAETNRRHVAQAQFRLGVCYLKKGSDAEARVALETLIREFPEQEQLVAQAREQLKAVQPALALEPVPWKDGEFLEYRISLATGKVIGALYLMAESTVVDGIESWQLELRKFAITAANNYGVSRVLVDRHTQRPISSTFRHGILGNADATYGPDGVEITGGATDTRVDSDQDVYDNEQSMHLLRMLPFELGYKATINFLPSWVGVIVEVGLEVTGKEICQVPAGDFDCYAVAIEVGQPAQQQTQWYSTGPERHLLKVRAGGVFIELAEIGRTEPGGAVAFSLEDLGLSGILPTGWLPYEHRTPGRADKAMVRFLDPEVETISAIEVDRCPHGNCPSLKKTAERELSGAQERFEAYELREGSWTERTIEGRPAISFVGDYIRDGKPWVQYRLYTMTDDLRLEFIFRTPTDRFEGLRAAFDSVAENLKAE